MKKIGILIPSLENKGPNIFARDLAVNMVKFGFFVELLYIKKVYGLDLCGITSKRISINRLKDLNLYDVIHTNMLRPDIIGCIYGIFNRKRKIVTTIHQYIFDDMSFSHGKIIAKLAEYIWINLLKWMNYKIVFLTEHMRNYYFKKYKLKDKNIFVIPNGRNMVNIKPKSPVNFTMGTMSLLIKRKGVRQVILAMKYLPNFVCHIVGDGPELHNLKRLSIENNCEDRVVFHGFQKDVSSYWDLFEIFVLPSYSEGFSLALIEAGLFSKKIVCSNIPQNKEMYSSSEAYFFNNNNINELVHNILLASKDNTIGKRANTKVIKNYTINIMTEKYRIIYLNI